MSSTATQEKRPGIFVALVPWVLFTFLVAHGTVQVAAVVALVASVAIALPGLLAGRPKVLELGAVATFAVFAVVAFAADRRHRRPSSLATPAAIAAARARRDRVRLAPLRPVHRAVRP